MTRLTKATPIFALGNLDTVTKAIEGVWFPILLPNGNVARSPSGLEIRVRLMGVDSPVYQDALAARQRQAIAEAQARRPGVNAPLTDGVKESIAILARVMTGWEGFEAPDSTVDEPKPIPFSLENVEAMLTGYPLIRLQVDRYVSDRANFLLEQQQG